MSTFQMEGSRGNPSHFERIPGVQRAVQEPGAILQQSRRHKLMKSQLRPIATVQIT